MLLGAIPLSAFCAPKIVETYYYYDVQGDNPAAIRADMDHKRKQQVRGGYDAYTSWFLKWRFRYSDELKGCKISAASTRLKVNYTLPRWIDNGAALAQTGERWHAYYRALLEHEQGHRQWGVAAADAIEQALLAMPHYNDCLTLRRDAHRLAARLLARHLRGEKNYDRVTRHGATQAAVFP